MAQLVGNLVVGDLATEYKSSLVLCVRFERVLSVDNTDYHQRQNITALLAEQLPDAFTHYAYCMSSTPDVVTFCGS